MEITNREVANAINALVEIQGQEVPAPLAFRFARILLAVDPISNAIEVARKALIDKHAKKDDKGVPIVRKGDNGADVIDLERPDLFSTELTELMDVKSTIGIDKLSLKDFDGVRIKPLHVLQLKWLIEEFDEPDDLEVE